MTWFRNVFTDPEEKLDIPGAQPQSTFMPVAVGGFAAVGGFIYGYDTGLINSISEMEYVRHRFAANHSTFTTQETSIMTAILSLGTFFGALMAPLISDTMGRRYAIIFSIFFVFMVGNICQVASNDIVLFCIGRFITGLSIGIISAVVPLYQAEASPKFIRGAIISTYQWAITWGLLVSSAVSQGTQSMNSSASYRVPVGLQFLWSLILGFGMILLPESPRFYVRKDDLNAAAKSLSRLRRVPPNDPGLIEELVEIKASHDYELSFGSPSLWDCFRSANARPHQRKRMLTGVMLQAMQQCSGINFIFYYGVNFFSKTGVHKSYTISLVTYAVNVVATVPGIMFVETIGRRKVLIIGGTIMGIANLIIAIVGTTTNSVIANKVMISFVCLFIASFAASWAPVVWVVCGEIFSLSVRGKAVALSAATNWLVNFVFAYVTPYMVDTGNHTAALGTRIFFIWGGFNLLGAVFVYLTVYETKNLSLEQIDELYRQCPNARSSGGFKVVPTLNTNVNSDDEEGHTNPNNPHGEHEDKELAPQGHITTSSDGSYPDSYQRPETAVSPVMFADAGTGINYDTQEYNEFDNPDYSVDLGYGLGLAGQNRGPPSLLTMTTDEESNFEHEFSEQGATLSEYVSRLSSMHRGSASASSNNQESQEITQFREQQQQSSIPEDDDTTTNEHSVTIPDNINDRNNDSGSETSSDTSSIF